MPVLREAQDRKIPLGGGLFLTRFHAQGVGEEDRTCLISLIELLRKKRRISDRKIDDVHGRKKDWLLWKDLAKLFAREYGQPYSGGSWVLVSEECAEAFISFLGCRNSKQIDIENFLFDNKVDLYCRMPSRDMLREAVNQTSSHHKASLEMSGADVYLISDRSRGVCKIGYSTNARERIKAIQTGYPHPLMLESVKPGTIDLEKALHKRFAGCRLSGEWFAFGDEIKKEFGLM